jgi:hypothetical protein
MDGDKKGIIIGRTNKNQTLLALISVYMTMMMIMTIAFGMIIISKLEISIVAC